MMKGFDFYSHKDRLKFLLLISAITIGVLSIWYTQRLVQSLSEEEEKKMELWSEATKYLLETQKENTDLTFFLKVIKNNTTIPVILTDEYFNILFYRNVDSIKALKKEYLIAQLGSMRNFHPPMKLELMNGKRNYLFYKESIILKRLRIYPYIQLSVIVVFIIISYLAFSYSRRAEQNKVWLGLSKETAHQLGTPTSSLMAWVELLKDSEHDPSLIQELEKDVQRLYTITERFSKIGSQPTLFMADIGEVIDGSVIYMRSRIPSSMKINFNAPEKLFYGKINQHLFGWVLENLIKNAIDALIDKGTIDIVMSHQNNFNCIDVKDTGKGISKSHIKKIFRPGFTTKMRGWGLGLSLTKRIIEEYHHGKIFVLNSEINKGTTIRILLPMVNPINREI